jgi:hypothetical protein
VSLDSAPSGAAIEIDGKPTGTTPIVVKTLAPGVPVTITFKKSGYHDAVAKITAPGPGKETQVIQPLAVSDEFARVKLVSEPPGAQVVENGQLVAGSVTPCELLIEASKPVHFMLTMPNKVPAVIEPFTPGRGADGIVRSGKLVDGVTVKLHANLDAKVKITNAPHCQDVALPLDCVLAPGTYIVDLVAPQAARITRTITVKDKELDAKFDLGYVEAAGGRLVQIGPGSGVRRAMFEAGARRVTVLGGEDGPHQVTVVVKPGATVVAN